MNKNTFVTVVIAGSMLATPLFASNFIHKLMTGKHPVHPITNLHAKPVAKKQSQDYTDFSGHWSGRCSLGDIDFPVFLAIENDDTHFNIEGEDFEIGPLHTKTQSDSSDSEYDHTSLEWSNDMSTLTMKYLALDKEHTSYPHNESSPMMTYIGQFTFSLANDQLNINGQSKGFMDLEQKGELNTMTCTLDQM